VTECPGERHPLLLASRELNGIVMGAIAKAHPLEEEIGPAPPVLAPELKRYLDVLAGRESGDEMEGLEDEADLLRTDPGSLILVQAAEVLPVEDHATASGAVESRQQAEERALPAPGRADDRDEGAGFHVESDIVQDGELAAAREVCLGEGLAAEDGRRRCHTRSYGADS
jgi:hypothetical protein